VDPVIEITGYDNLGVTLEEVSLSDADFELRLEEIRQRLAEVKKAERPSATGDLVTARYLKVVIEGEERPAAQPVFQAELGKGIADVDAALTGVVEGAEVTIEFTFPADYADAEQAGKKAVYEVKVENVYERVVPEFTDEFVAQLGPFENVDAFRARVREDLLENLQQEARRKAHDAAVDAILAKNDFPVAKARVETYVNWQRDRMVQQGAQVPSLEEMVATFGEQAAKTLRGQRAVEWITEKESIKATTEEVDGRIRLLAAQAGISAEDAREELRKTGRLMEIRETLRFEKTLDWLVGKR
jgi:trigger factor